MSSLRSNTLLIPQIFEHSFHIKITFRLITITEALCRTLTHERYETDSRQPVTMQRMAFDKSYLQVAVNK